MMASLSEEHIKTLSRILSIDTHISDEGKAMKDFIRIVNEEMRVAKIFDVLNSGSVEKLNEMIKKNN